MGRPKLRTEALRDVVLAAAVGLVERDRASLTARGVAAAAETSTAAVYELFEDKAGLLRAIYVEAFRTLRNELAAVDVTSDSRADLVGLLAATRRYARSHPMLFEVMFARPFAELDPDPADVEAALGVMKMVLDAVRRAIESAVLSGDRRDIAHVLVAVNRGLVTTELAGMAGSSRANIDRRWRLGIDAVLDGLAPKE